MNNEEMVPRKNQTSNMKNLKFPLLFAIAAFAFGFIPTEAKAQYHGGGYCEQVVRYYQHCDGWYYKVIRYYDHSCRSWRERHVRVSRVRESHGYHGSYGREYSPPRYAPRPRYSNHREVRIGGIGYTVDSRRGLNRSCR